jgi:hypothetical protein
MSFDIEDIPDIESAGRLGRRASADSRVADAYPLHPTNPSDFFASIGVPVALRLVDRLQARVFPSSSDIVALASFGGSYTTHSNCGGFDYGATCNEACFGFAPHHMDPFYCATCDEQAADPANNPSYNWHFVGSRGQIQYKDMEPDACNGRDAWKWTIEGPCGNCQQSSVYRCHDGYKKYPNNSYWDPTICQGLVACDGTLTPCP